MEHLTLIDDVVDSNNLKWIDLRRTGHWNLTIEIICWRGLVANISQKLRHNTRRTPSLDFPNFSIWYLTSPLPSVKLFTQEITYNIVTFIVLYLYFYCALLCCSVLILMNKKVKVLTYVNMIHWLNITTYFWIFQH